MKTLNIPEAEGNLAHLIAQAHAGEDIVLTDGKRQVFLAPRGCIDPETDSPELEAALLQAVRGPHRRHQAAGLRKIAERIRGEGRIRAAR